MVNREAGLVWTTRVAVIAFLGLLLALLVIAVTSVFGLKVAGQHTTEGFIFLVPLLLALMGGGLVLNVILNLNKIGEHTALRSGGGVIGGPGLPARWLVVAGLVVVTTLALLFGGDHYTRNQKERFLLNDARASVATFTQELNALGALPWGVDLLANSAGVLQLMGKQNKSFPSVSLLIQEPVRGKPLVLQLGSYSKSASGQVMASEDDKVDHVRALSPDERSYLDGVFTRGEQVHRYSANDGDYELFYPVRLGSGRWAVLYFAQNMRYGKGSS
jgi:hypothetical protein